MLGEKIPQYTILGLILAVIIVGAAGFTRPTVISTIAEENRLDVTGTATLSVSPDEIIILAGAETEAASAADSQLTNAGMISGMRTALNRTGLAAENVTTASYSLDVIREYDEKTNTTKISYRTTHILRIKSSDTTKAGDYVDAAVDGGANRVDGISFTLSDSKETEIRTQALKLAGQDARSKADASAQGLGVSVKRVVRANEGYISIYPYATEMRASPSAGAATEITPGQVEVSASIGVTYEIG